MHRCCAITRYSISDHINMVHSAFLLHCGFYWNTGSRRETSLMIDISLVSNGGRIKVYVIAKLAERRRLRNLIVICLQHEVSVTFYNLSYIFVTNKGLPEIFMSEATFFISAVLNLNYLESPSYKDYWSRTYLQSPSKAVFPHPSSGRGVVMLRRSTRSNSVHTWKTCHFIVFTYQLLFIRTYKITDILRAL